MFKIFLFIFNCFVVLSLNFGRSGSESGSNEFFDRRGESSLRKERIDAGVCENAVELPENWDLCFPDIEFAINANFTPNESHCRCDDECTQFKDCCVDKLSEQFIEEHSKPDSCIELFSSGFPMNAVYGIDKCNDNWMETSFGVKDKCELNVEQYESTGQRYSYLQDIAVLSPKFMYKNIFCAVCNNDSNSLKVWNITLNCKGFQIEGFNQINLDPDNYNSSTKIWNVFVNNKMINCTIGVQQFIDNEFLFTENKLRKCKKTFDKCPQNMLNTSVSQKCESYASYVYYMDKTYKNYHCALCNGAPIGWIECFPNESVMRKPQDWTRSSLWFPLLLDFNYAGDKGQWVGGQAKCPIEGQMYDPLYKMCVSIECKDNSTEKCNLNEFMKSDSNSDCFGSALLQENQDFMILDNNSIYINITKRLLEEEIYQIIDDNTNNIRKLKICRNKSQLTSDSLIQSPFDIDFAQIVLSEISLYLSIFCLSIHIMIYTFLPKLQNLPGKNLLSLSWALLLGHISFSLGSYLRADRKIVCVLVAIIAHYSYLAAFFWMSVMAFDVCKTFGKTRRRTKNSKRYLFLKYSLYGWLSPAFIVMVASAFDIGLEEGNKFRPQYGLRFCWISERQALLAFFALPVAIIVCINIFLFSLTAKGLIQTEEQTKILNKKSDKIRYFLYIKLAFLMGVTWIIGFAASLSGWKALWYPFIILNGLQGTVIFIAFSCKRKVCKLLAEKFGFKKGYQTGTTTTDIIRSATGSTSLQTSTLVPSSPDSNVTKIKFTK